LVAHTELGFDCPRRVLAMVDCQQRIAGVGIEAKHLVTSPVPTNLSYQAQGLHAEYFSI
jgi:hypothetical protein